MGDALATFVEARCAAENPHGESSVRLPPTYDNDDVDDDDVDDVDDVDD